MLACVSKEEFMDFTLKIVECSMLLMKKKSRMSGKPISQHVFIFDLEGFSLKVKRENVHIHYLIIVGSYSWSNYGDFTEVDFCL